jgi:predicted phage tail protein
MATPADGFEPMDEQTDEIRDGLALMEATATAQRIRRWLHVVECFLLLGAPLAGALYLGGYVIASLLCVGVCLVLLGIRAVLSRRGDRYIQILRRHDNHHSCK